MNDSDHGRVVRIFVCLSRGLYCHRKSKRALEQWWPTVRQKCSYLYHQGEFQHNYYDFVSLQHSDHDGVVRIFVGHSEIVKRFNDYIIQVAELASLAQLLPPCSPTCVIRRRTALRQSCCSPIASASAAARRLH